MTEVLLKGDKIGPLPEFCFYLLLVVGITLIGNVIDGAKDKAGIFLIGVLCC